MADALPDSVSPPRQASRSVNWRWRPLMPFDKILDGGRHVAHLKIAAPAQLVGDILGNILRPAIGGIEADDADRAMVMAA
jgi:hypothetical protein